MSELNQIHEEAKKEKESKEKTKLDRKTALQNRLKKVRDKKRLKMGLPMLDLDDEDEEKPEEFQKEESPEDLVLKALKDIREKEEEAKRKLIVREWDEGKDGETLLTMKPAEKKVLSQQEWVKTKRSERPKEFAPPVNLYQKDKSSGGSFDNSNPFRTSKPVKTKPVNPPRLSTRPERPNEFAPPVNLYENTRESFDCSNPFRTAKPVKTQCPKPVNCPQLSTRPEKSKEFAPPVNLYQQVKKAEESSESFSNSNPFRTSNPVKTQFPKPVNPPPLPKTSSLPQPVSFRLTRPQASYGAPRPLHPQGPPPKIRPQSFQQNFQQNNSDNPPPPGFHQVNFSYSAGPTKLHESKFESHLNSNEKSHWEPQETTDLLSTSISKTSRLEMHRQMNEGLFEMSKPIVNELEEHFEPEEIILKPKKEKVSGKSVEIPPPCDMEYYASTSSDNKRSNWKGMRTR